jgi:hypothetical protein
MLQIFLSSPSSLLIYILSQLVPHSLGTSSTIIESGVRKDVIDILIKKNTPIPFTSKWFCYYPVEEGQKKLHVDVYQGEALQRNSP